jgi:hypothetical protein
MPLIMFELVVEVTHRVVEFLPLVVVDLLFLERWFS